MDVEMQVEKLRLEHTIEVINKETLAYIEKRKAVTKYILEYRQKTLEEYKLDDDKVAEYFDHERYVKEEAFKTIDRKLKELTVLSTSPYFGRVDFKEEGLDEIENIYVGRFGLTPEETYEPLVVDWRAPVASLFYTGSLGKAVYKAPAEEFDCNVLLKRQYIIKKQKLQGMFDSAVDVKDDILQMVLSKNAGDKLKDIIMTIQNEQDNIIRFPREKNVVVDGVAGSGKTTIALHRVAYLLYNYREILQDKVLILGPNNIFMEYISTVLPSLGEVGVKQTTFTNFALDALDMDNIEIMDFKEYMERCLSKDEDFINEILYKTSEEYIKELDAFIENMDNGYFKYEGVNFRGREIVSKEEIQKMFGEYYKHMPLFRRSKKIKRVIFAKLKDARDEIMRDLEADFKKRKESMSPKELLNEENNLAYTRRNMIRELIFDLMQVKASLVWLKNLDVMSLYSGFNGNKKLTQDDLAPLMHLRIRLEGLKTKSEIKHVVIDEAQDYSKLQFSVIKEFTKAVSMTVVGDSNQRIIPLNGKIPMLTLEDILTDRAVETFRLNKSYRSTKEIMEYANKYIDNLDIVPLVRSGEAVVFDEITGDEELVAMVRGAIEDFRDEDLESIAIVCRNLEETKRVGELLKSVPYLKVIDKEEMLYTGGLVVLPSYFAKGLEFDGVIFLESSVDSEDKKLKYVMATRALHKLYNFVLK